MAKITTEKFEIAGKEYQVHINCTSTGQFNANIPQFVATALGIDARLSSINLSDIVTALRTAIRKYKEAETSQELFILIRYRASGDCNWSSKGTVLFNQQSPYHLSVSFESSSVSCVALDYKLAFKETVDGVVKWYEAREGHKFFNESEDENKLYKGSHIWDSSLKNFKAIPYSEIAVASLDNAKEKLRAASELLFNFIEQDEEQILLTLTNQKLLQ